MNRLFKSASTLAAIFGIMLAVSGCGSEDQSNGGGGPGAPGYAGGIVNYAGGGGEITFTGTNVYTLTNNVVAGMQESSGNCGVSCFGGYFQPIVSGALIYDSWLFSNMDRQNFGTGSIVLGGTVLTATTGAMSYNGTSRAEAGATIQIVAIPTDQFHSNISGRLVLPPSFMSRGSNVNAFPQGVMSIRNIVLDLYSSNANGLNGGVLLYTNGTNGVRGAFLKF